jgi:hypothetical protein
VLIYHAWLTQLPKFSFLQHNIISTVVLCYHDLLTQLPKFSFLQNNIISTVVLCYLNLHSQFHTVFHDSFLYNTCIDYNSFLKITIKSSILGVYRYITVVNWQGRGVGHGIKPSWGYLWYLLFQTQWDRCDTCKLSDFIPIIEI